MSCAHFEAEEEAARVEGEAWYVSPFIHFHLSYANLIGAFKRRGTRDTCHDRRLDPTEPVGAARGTRLSS
jgi:hypothetical protein